MATPVDDLLDQVSSGTFREWLREVCTDDPLQFVDRCPYSERLAKAKAGKPSAESIRAGFARIGGHEVTLFASDYQFMAGTMGIAAADRIVRTVVAATSRGLPVVAICRSGGTRMQEGTPAFVKMMSIGAVISEHREAGLPFLTYLMGPSMGGALASWGSQGHLVWAAPEGTISLTGPRVVEVVTGASVDVAELSAEVSLKRGLIDEIVEPERLGTRVSEFLDALVQSAGAKLSTLDEQPALEVSVLSGTGSSGQHRDAWRSVQVSRSPTRPGIRSFLACGDTPIAEVRGDRNGANDEGLVAAVTRLRGWPVMMIGFSRESGRGASVTPAGYRKALRAVRLAAELRLSLVTLIDTAGAATGVAAEQAGLANVIGELMRELLRVTVPTVSVLTGEGSGAGAIALLAADRQLATENAWLTPIAPEAGSAILFRTPEEAPRMARSQRASAAAMYEDGLVDEVIPDPVEGHKADLAEVIVDRIVAALADISVLSPERRLEKRRVRTRSLSRHHLVEVHPSEETQRSG